MMVNKCSPGHNGCAFVDSTRTAMMGIIKTNNIIKL